MRRGFWIGVGAAAAVVAVYVTHKAYARYAPASVAERVETTARDVETRAHHAVAEFRSTFGEARASREAELMAALLAEGQDASVQQRAPKASSAGARATGARAKDFGVGSARTALGGGGPGAFDGDEDILGYSF
jgi:hypothetical protein